MSKPKLSETNDEIDIRELLLTLWKGKYIIFSILVVAVLLSSMHLRNSVRKYSVEAVFKPVVEASGSPNLTGLSGLASFAGMALPTSTSSDFTTYQQLLFSEEVAGRVFSNRDLIIKLFKGEWHSDTGLFAAPLGRQSFDLKQVIKSALTGVEKGQYIPPNPKRLSMLMASTLNVSVDNSTGFISISTETSEPNLMVELILKASQETDKLLKERFFATAEDTLEFYYQKLLTSRSPEHREALAKLISVEDQKLMLASKSSNFVAEPLTSPSVSLYPTSPDAKFILVLGFVVGILFGGTIVIIRHFIKTPKVIK